MSQLDRFIKKTGESYQINNKSEYYQFGFKEFGPLLYGFTKWLRKQFDDMNIKKVFFFSRDGFMMKKAFDTFSRNDTITSTYTYFSRKSLRQSLFLNCNDYYESLQYLSSMRYISTKGILEYYGFDEEEVLDIIKEYDLDVEHVYVAKELSIAKDIEKLYNSLKNRIYEKSYASYQVLVRYLEQIDMSGDCAIVDIGWNGSMQFYLEKVLDIYQFRGNICGFYMGINTLYPVKGKTYGYLYNNEDGSLRKKVLCSLGVWEKLFQSMEGSSVGYIVNEHNQVEPVKGQYEYAGDVDCMNNIQEWQQGAMDFLTACQEQNQYIPDIADDREWAKSILKFGQYPSKKDTELFRFFYIDDDGKQFFTARKKLHQYKLKEFMHDLSNSPWKTGFMKSVFVIPFPYYVIYRILRR